MYSDTGNTTSLVLGSPIRTSSDQRSVDSSPRLIAASYVLHRPLMPRHPPCALKHLQHKNQSFQQKTKKLHHNDPHQHSTPPPPHPRRGKSPTAPATAANRCSQPLSTNQTPHPTTKTWGNNTPPTTRSGQGNTGLLSQSPIVCLMVPAPPHEWRSNLKSVVRKKLLHQNRRPLQVPVHLTIRSGRGDPRDAGRPKTRGAP